jgi:hypothetical protein
MDGLTAPDVHAVCVTDWPTHSSQDPGGLRVQELPPGWSIPARRRVDAHREEHCPPEP